MPSLERYPSIYPEEADVNASSERFIKHSSSKLKTQLRGAFNRLINSAKKRSSIEDFSSAGPSGSSITIPIIYTEIQEMPEAPKAPVTLESQTPITFSDILEVPEALEAPVSSNSSEITLTDAPLCVVPPVLNTLGECHINDLDFLENRRNVLHKKTNYIDYTHHVHVPGTSLPPHLRVPVIKNVEAKVPIGISTLNPMHPYHSSMMWDYEYEGEGEECKEEEVVEREESMEREEEEYEEEYDSLDDHPTEDFYSCIEFNSDDDISGTSDFFNLDNIDIGEAHFEVDDSDEIIEVLREVEICGGNKGKNRAEDFTEIPKKTPLTTISVRMEFTQSQDSIAQEGPSQFTGVSRSDPTSPFDRHSVPAPQQVLDLLDADDDDDVTQLSHSSDGLGTVWTSIYPSPEPLRSTLKWFSLAVAPEIVLSSFNREVKALGRVRDCVEGVSSVETFMTNTTAAAYSMKWMGINTLRDYMYGGTTIYSLHETARQVSRLINAVSKMHKLGVIHGNIKPETIMVGPVNDFIIFDFGNATVLDLDYIKFRQNLNNPDSLWTTFADDSLEKGSTVSFDVDYTTFAEIWHEMRTGEPFKHVHSRAFGDMVQMREDVLLEDEMVFIRRLFSKRKGQRFETLREIQQDKVFRTIRWAP